MVAYAAERFVTVIPEIEMPGHATAALASYPVYGCRLGPYEVATTWGVLSDLFCPFEATFWFLQDVLAEVIGLFPGTYIHIGGDEVLKAQWRQSRLAQDAIAREGLSDEDELQGWFMRRMAAFLHANGRRMIAWDEILEGGGLSLDATVMSWRGTVGGIEAAKLGHDVVMTPRRYTYFDYSQGIDLATEPLARPRTLRLETVYAFEPVPDELTDQEATHILGAQGQLWTEYIKTGAHLEYMAYPRAMALAEVVWSPARARDLNGFYRRLEANLQHLDALGVNYRMPDAFTGTRASPTDRTRLGSTAPVAQ